MLVSSRQISGSKVFDADGRPVGRLSRVIIDPDNGSVLAFELDSRGPRYISPHDLVSWKSGYLTLGQDFDLHGAGELVRLDRLLHQQPLDLVGRKVATESGTALGKVTDYTVDAGRQVLASLTVRKTFLGLWYYDTRLIRQSQIVEIRPQLIVVRDSLLRVPARQKPGDEFDLQNAPTLDQALSVPEDRTSS
jgi:sporulation protein YlmC with PRC-barrel domain